MNRQPRPHLGFSRLLIGLSVLLFLQPWLVPLEAAGAAPDRAPSRVDVFGSTILSACPDADLDGWADCTVPGCDPTGLTCGDCDDDDYDVNPGQTETCNHKDDDCDGAVDEGWTWSTATEKVLDPQRHSGDEFGTSLSVIGDVDGDQVPDFVVGSPKNGAGRVVLFSGSDRSMICRTTDGASGEYIGATVAGIGDVTGDGIPDFAAAVPRGAAGAGAIAIYSGNPADQCSLVRRCLDPQGIAGDYLGSDSLARGQGLAGWADITGDGVPEIIAGGPESDRAAADAGIVVVFDPTTDPNCTVVHRVFEPGPQAGAMLGRSVVGLDDVTGDGIPDFAAGADGYDDTYADAGAVEIFSGATGAPFVRRLLDPSRNSDRLGFSLDAVADQDGDGYGDLVAGAPYRDTAAGTDAGQVLILSSAGGSDPVLLRMDEGPDGATYEHLGRSVATAEDTDGDGVPEVLAGAYDAYSSRATRDGHAVLFSGLDGSTVAVFEDPEGADDDNLGWSVAGIGDVTGDGAGDFLAGALDDDVPKTGTNAGSVLLFALESDCDDDGIGPFGGDCDDQDPDRFPGNPEICDGLDNDCDIVADEDGDGDGYTVCEEESAGCDPGGWPDDNPLLNPSAAEICNGVDDDCDGSVDDGQDLDADGYETPCDCDDDPVTGPAIHPGATEVCNHADDNCGAVDEGFPAVVTQAKLHDPDRVGALFGRAVAAVGDVNGDGVPDFAVGYPGDHTAGSWRGSVMLHSGADRTVICRAVNDEAGGGEQLGFPVVGTGDLNGDAYPDFAAVAYLSDAQAYDAGEVILFSGFDCSVIRHCKDPNGEAYDHLGEENGLAAGDLDGDGVAEIVTGAQLADPGGHNDAGKAVVFDGTDCFARFTLTDPLGVSYDLFGAAVAVVGDVTGDGVPDIAVGETRDDWVASDGGSVLIFSGSDGAFVRRLTDPETGVSDYLGFSVAGVEDLDGDGWPEIVAGVPKKNPGTGGDAGELVIFSGRDGAILYRAYDAAGGGNDNLGWSVSVSPDVDGDGVPEIVTGAPYADTAGGTDAGRAVLFSGATGAKIRSLEDSDGRMQDYAGFSVAGIGDLNDDGSPEILAGASHDDIPKYGNDSGAVLVFLTESDCDSDGYGPTGLDCDDTDADIYGGCLETCDSKDNDCDLETDEDEDGDGYDACAEEASCNPADEPNRNPLMYPGAAELCNGLDDDCDGSVDEGNDLDGDGYETPCDCNDDPGTGGAVHPGATETCNHADENCGGGVDEGFAQADSQETVLDSYPVAGDFFGTSVAGIGDVTGDGVPDFVVGAPSDDTPGGNWGQTTVYSGSDRRVYCRTEVAGETGQMVAGIPDLDGDTIPDFVASAPGADAVILFSGATCMEIARCEDPYAAANGLGDERGLAVADVTGDGTPEILAGAPNANVWEHHAGTAFVFSYSTSGGCTVLYELHDPDAANQDTFGNSLDGVGDVTGDGAPDIVVGEPHDDTVNDDNGSVLIFSGADGSFARRLTDPAYPNRGNHVGITVSGMEDLNDDGWPEIVAGVEWGDLPVGDAGYLVVFSGKDGTVVRRITDPDSTGGERLGWSLAAVEDMDGDGVHDLVAGAYFATVGGVTQTGRAVVFSGKTGDKLRTFDNPDPEAYDHFGYAVGSAGDIAGDGVPEILVGTPYTDGVAGLDTGSVVLFAVESDCDGDGKGPWSDCAAGDPDLWSVPSECGNVTLGSDKTTLTWDAPSEPGNTSGSMLYDTLRSPDASDFDTATCLESDDSDLTASDGSTPVPGTAFYYLVRAQNGCGDGDLGEGGTPPDDVYPRTGQSCP